MKSVKTMEAVMTLRSNGDINSKGMAVTRQLKHAFLFYVYPGLVWTGRNLPKSSPTQSDEREIFRELNYANKKQ